VTDTRVGVVLLGLALAACGSSSSSPAAAPPPEDAGVDPTIFSIPAYSCVFTCDGGCAEWSDGYQCQNLGDWNAIPHDPTACGDFDGGIATPAAAQCTASPATGDAIKYAGPDPDDATVTILPDGRRVKAAGAEWIFDEPDLTPNAPVNVLPVAGTKYLLVVDMAYETQSVRVVDQTLIGSGTTPVVSSVPFPVPQALGSPIVFVPPGLVLVATDDGVVQALSLDTTTGALAVDDAKSIMLPASIDDQNGAANYYVGGLALSPDASKLVVTGIFDHHALVFDLSAATYGTQLGSVDIGAGGTFKAAFDPNDATGHFAYATLWGGHALVEIDVSTPSAPVKTRTLAIDKNPQGFDFLDSRWIAVANDLGDAIDLVDRTTATVTPVPIDMASSLPGIEPCNLAYDATNARLYATLCGSNAVSVWSVDTTMTPPALSPLGRLPTSWWPTSVAILPGGDLAITSMRGHSNGPLQMQFTVGNGDSMHEVRGGIQTVPMPSAADLAAGETSVGTFDNAGAVAGTPTVSCPNAENDFPLPPTNTQGPSKQIRHVIFVLRENKTYDGVLGDLPTVNGDPTLTLEKTTPEMDKLWLNFRNLVRAFATDDNYYTDAELSNQGHTWTTYGRQTDFNERTWAMNGYSRNIWVSQVQPQGTSDIGQPIEGSMFDWLQNNSVTLKIEGEGEGTPAVKTGVNSLDLRYPGGFIQNIGYPDVEKACYVAGKLRVVCDMPQVMYMTMPNDHTESVDPTTPSPELMIATNDEATGMLVDALSHSPYWASSLVIVTEDDPADGGDHVEHHRTPILFASPWIKHGYVSKQHLGVASMHKMIAHLFGIPYPNDMVANAPLPLDLFSSTPDVTPYTYTPREWPATCGTQPTLAEQRLRDSWDFDDVDEQPGLDQQIARYLRGNQRQALTPEMERDIANRKRMKGR
jgi:hypothetical protein